MKRNIDSPSVLVFDFDGTITRLDIFKIIIVLKIIQPSSWPSIKRTFQNYWKSERLTLRQSLYSVLWHNSKERLAFFDRFFNYPFTRLLLRKSMIDLIRKSVGEKKVLILSANEREIISAFVSSFFPDSRESIDIIATDSLRGEKPIKGKLKATKYRLFMKQHLNGFDSKKMHCFFDSKTDFLLAKQSHLGINLNKCHAKIGINKKLGFITFKEYLNGTN